MGELIHRTGRGGWSLEEDDGVRDGYGYLRTWANVVWKGDYGGKKWQQG